MYELDKSVLASQLEVNCKNLHQMTKLVKKLQDEKALLEQKLNEAHHKNESLEQCIETLKVRVFPSSSIFRTTV